MGAEEIGYVLGKDPRLSDVGVTEDITQVLIKSVPR